MSYILEALKKSESERQQASSPPSIYTPKSPPPVEPEKDQKKSRLLLWCTLTIFVILLFVAGYHLYDNKQISITITVPEKNTSSKPENMATTASPAPTSEPQAAPESPADAPLIQPVNKKAVTANETSEKMEVPLPENIDVQATMDETTSQRSYVPRLDELDTAFQSKVPELKLAGHVSTEDASLRMILVNDRIVREKGAAASGFILDEITPDGIILRKGSTLFRIDIP